MICLCLVCVEAVNGVWLGLPPAARRVWFLHIWCGQPPLLPPDKVDLALWRN